MDKVPTVLWGAVPLGLCMCLPTQPPRCQTSYNPLRSPHRPQPRGHQLPAPGSGAAIKLAPPGFHQEPFLIHSPEKAKHGQPASHLPGWAPSGSSHPGETETSCRSACGGHTCGGLGSAYPALPVTWARAPRGGQETDSFTSDTSNQVHLWERG